MFQFVPTPQGIQGALKQRKYDTRIDLLLSTSTYCRFIRLYSYAYIDVEKQSIFRERGMILKHEM